MNKKLNDESLKKDSIEIEVRALFKEKPLGPINILKEYPES